MNLLRETIEILKENNKQLSDVKWFGTSEFSIDGGVCGLFDFDYDNSYGGNEIPLELIVVGDDWWLERAEYDGSEWWEFKSKPKTPKKTINNNKAISLLI